MKNLFSAAIILIMLFAPIVNAMDLTCMSPHEQTAHSMDHPHSTEHSHTDCICDCSQCTEHHHAELKVFFGLALPPLSLNAIQTLSKIDVIDNLIHVHSSSPYRPPIA